MDRKNRLCPLADQASVGFLERCRRWLRGARQILAGRQLLIKAGVVEIHAVQICLVAKEDGQWHDRDAQLTGHLCRQVGGAVGDNANDHRFPLLIPGNNSTWLGVPPALSLPKKRSPDKKNTDNFCWEHLPVSVPVGPILLR